jgi:hypothetical protein
MANPIPFAYDVLLPEGPLANGVLHLNRLNGEFPYCPGALFYLLGKDNRAYAVHITHVDQPFVYAIGLFGTIYHLFDPNDPSKLFQGVSSKAIGALRAGQAVLLLDCSGEGDCRQFDETFTNLYQMCRVMGFSPTQVVFVCSNLECQDRHAEWVCEHQLPDACTVLSFNLFRQFMADRLRFQLGEFVTEADLPRRRSKHFLCYNRQPRNHRYIVVSQLLKHWEKAYISFPPLDYNKHIQVSWRPAGIPSLSADLQRLDAVRPLVVDQTDFEFNHALTHVAWPYRDSYISLTNETVFTQAEGVFLSEKTYRPIANLQPFLLIGSAGSLRHLRAMGFRTFAPFIDERYDEEADHERRMLLLLAEIDRLAALPLDVIHEWYISIVPDLLHNKQVLLDTPDSCGELARILTSMLNR